MKDGQLGGRETANVMSGVQANGPLVARSTRSGRKTAIVLVSVPALMYVVLMIPVP